MFVVSVGSSDSTVSVNAKVNTETNATVSNGKLAGDDLDAELDIIYYLTEMTDAAGEKTVYDDAHGSYTFTDTEKKSMIISFDVKYPDIQGLDAQTGAKINEEIKKCAMSTVDRIYENPSAEFKEKMLGIENPILASLVTYKVCYASNDFISIVFEETGAEGDPDESVQHLRTLNIGIKDGKV